MSRYLNSSWARAISLEDAVALVEHVHEAADSVMCRQALPGAAQARGWSVRWYDREHVFGEAAAAVGRKDIGSLLAAMGRSLGSPWQATHKLAAAAAIANLNARARSDGA